MNLLIAWQDSDSAGYIDVLPSQMFASEGSQEVTHIVRGPKGGEYAVKCTVKSLGKVAKLDYRPFPENTKHFQGVLRLTFTDSDRSGVPTAIHWKPDGERAYAEAIATVSCVPETTRRVPIYGDEGEPIHSNFSIEAAASGIQITLESRGGTIGTSSERNRGYSTGLRLIIRRLGQTRCRLEQASLASRSSSLSTRKRQVVPNGFNLPFELSPDTDEVLLARALRQALGEVGANHTSGGGNTTRRLQLVVSLPKGLAVTALTQLLSTGMMKNSMSQADVDGAAEGFGFDPSDDSDARKKTLAAIACRQGQRGFRDALKNAYGGMCAVTRCTVVEVLEAAHIKGYKGPKTNHVQNGLLLRADIHTLFDMGLIGINPDTWKVVIHKDLRSGSYGDFHDSTIQVPTEPHQRPNKEALVAHLEQHELNP